MYIHIGTIIIHDHSVNSSSKLTIGLGIGGGVSLLVAVVLCIMGTVYYKRCVKWVNNYTYIQTLCVSIAIVISIHIHT